MTPRHLVLGAALLVAAGFAIFGDKSPPGVVEPVERAAVAAPARIATTAPVKTAATVTILRLAPRDALIGDGAAAGNAFGALDWTPPPPPPAAPPPPPPPSAPPLPFTVVGKAFEHGVWEVFLARGAETLIVRDKMVIDGVYRIDTIAPPAMTMTYLPLNQVQQINIGVRD
jgi:hypothetical protein